jgi:hypothetical protein
MTDLDEQAIEAAAKVKWMRAHSHAPKHVSPADLEQMWRDWRGLEIDSYFKLLAETREEVAAYLDARGPAQARERRIEHETEETCNCEFPNECLFEAGFKAGFRKARGGSSTPEQPADVSGRVEPAPVGDSTLIYVDRVPHRVVVKHVSREDILGLSDVAKILPRTAVWLEGGTADREVGPLEMVAVAHGTCFYTAPSTITAGLAEDARCRCGHTAHWHAAVVYDGHGEQRVPQGAGICEEHSEDGSPCGCERFVHMPEQVSTPEQTIWRQIAEECKAIIDGIYVKTLPYQPPLSSKLGPGPAIDRLIELAEQVSAPASREQATQRFIDGGGLTLYSPRAAFEAGFDDGVGSVSAPAEPTLVGDSAANPTLTGSLLSPAEPTEALTAVDEIEGLIRRFALPADPIVGEWLERHLGTIRAALSESPVAAERTEDKADADD